MNSTMTVRFLGEDCEVRFTKYADNDRTAIELFCANGEPMARATVNVPEAKLAEDEVLIKDWSENEGILAVLEEAGIVEATGGVVACGFVHADVCRLVQEANVPV